MKRPRILGLGALATVAVVALLAGACGGGSSGSSTPAAGSGGSGKVFKIGLVTDIGGLDDKSFNHLAFVGIQRAKSQLGIDFKVLESHQESEYVPNLQTLAAQHYDLVIAVGFLMDGAIKKVAKAFPDVNFAIIDDAPDPALPNVQGLLFKEQESGYLAGYLAALESKTGTVSTVGGQKIPPVDHYIAGFQAGAKAANPNVKTLNDYSNSFTDTAKCKQLALNQISQGSDVVFQVAGGCGLGALSAAKEKGVWGIGVDADQAYLGDYILTSAIKKVDVAVFDTIKQVVDGTFQGGGITTFDATKGATGLGAINSSVPQSDVQKVDAQLAQLKSGSITPPDTVP
ncbi:MAG TPA: BMP family ABC transporter substrate-binding protein [Gaiellales bacterium]|nr:BMP family ABC transporter substrate-binding protein [Gaiellales bacterium]